MTPVPHPQTRLAYSAEPQPAHRSEFRARKQHTLFLIHAIGLAHLGSIGVEVERIILRDRRVAWRAPLSVRPEARQYENTFRALDHPVPGIALSTFLAQFWTGNTTGEPSLLSKYLI